MAFVDDIHKVSFHSPIPCKRVQVKAVPTVIELRKSLKEKGLSTRGNKIKQLDRLKKNTWDKGCSSLVVLSSGGSSQSPPASPGSDASQVDRVDCAFLGDGVAMVNCDKCGAWSHQSCYCLTEDQVKDTLFRYFKCGSNFTVLSPSLTLVGQCLSRMTPVFLLPMFLQPICGWIHSTQSLPFVRT